MDITVLPETGSTHIIEDNFIQELSLRVDLTGNASSRPIQCLIFKPAGRARDEFDHVIETFENTGKRLDDLIVITATARDRSISNAPAEFNCAFKACVFLTEKNEIHPESNDVLEKLADFLIHNYGFKRPLHGKKGKDKRLYESQTTDRRQEKELKQEIKRLTQEVERLQHELEHSKTKADQDKHVQEIRFEVQRAKVPLLGCFGQRKVPYDVSRYAVEEEIANIENEVYDFQRKYEKKFKLEPGKLRKVLEFIPSEWKNVSGNGLTIEGDGFQCLIAMVNDTFRLPPDRFKELLKKISQKYKGKGKRGPSYEEKTALGIDNETYSAKNHPSTGYWLGGYYIMALNEWAWDDMTQLTYTRWGPSQPYHSTYSYRIYMVNPKTTATFTDWMWAVDSSGLGKGFICERPFL